MGNIFSIDEEEEASKKDKNFDYYFGKKRMTYITREFYPHCFYKGYIYGRYPKRNMINWYNDQKIIREWEDKVWEKGKNTITREF